MEKSQQDLTDRLLRAVQDLPEERIAEAIDFAEYLQSKYGRPQPPRGSAEAILNVLDNGGALQFEPGELDTILEELAGQRIGTFAAVPSHRQVSN